MRWVIENRGKYLETYSQNGAFFAPNTQRAFQFPDRRHPGNIIARLKEHHPDRYQHAQLLSFEQALELEQQRSIRRHA